MKNIDPSRTLTLRRRFAADMTRRFTFIRRAIIQAVDELDVFGLKEENRLQVNLQIQPRQFEFTRSDEKIDQFMKWLKELEENKILETVSRPGVHAGTMPWTNTYIQTAYQKGIARGRSELRKAGYSVPGTQAVTPLGTNPITVAFNQPFHVERVALLYQRTFNELKGITAAMDQQISRVLAEGLAQGLHPRVLAQQLANRVDKIGITRAKTLARTEVINAHHKATIAEYRQWGAEGVTVVAEFETAGYNVCPICKALAEGGPYTLDEIENMIPVHPNCRCVAIPKPKPN